MELNEAGLHEETLHKVCEAICGLGGIDYTTCFPDIVAHIKATVPVSLDWDRDTGNGFNERGYSAGSGTYHDPMGD